MAARVARLHPAMTGLSRCRNGAFLQDAGGGDPLVLRDQKAPGTLSGKHTTVREVWEAAILAAFCRACGRYEIHRSHAFSLVATEGHIQKKWSVEGNSEKGSFILFKGQAPFANGKHIAHIIFLLN